MGLNHEQLTYRHAGRDFRLTDVAGNVLHDIVVSDGKLEMTKPEATDLSSRSAVYDFRLTDIRVGNDRRWRCVGRSSFSTTFFVLGKRRVRLELRSSPFW